MAETEAQSVLRRMTAAGREAARADRAVQPARALASGLSRAAEAAMSLAVSATSSAERVGGLTDLLETVPESGLLAVLEGPGEAQGLISLDSALLSAVIEKQMTGGLSPKAPPARPVTRTDAALAADLIDAMLREFETPLRSRKEARWACGFGYSSHVEDIRPLGLLLEDVDYRIFVLELDLELGSRSGRAILALPAEGRGDVVVAENVAEPEVPRDVAWQEGFGTAVRGADVRLEAIMHRVKLPFSRVRKLEVGDEIPLPATCIDRVRLVGAGGGTFAVGRLGQSRGNRAVRVAAFGDRLPMPARVSAGNSILTLPDLPEVGEATKTRKPEQAARAAPKPTAAPAGAEPASSLPQLPDPQPLRSDPSLDLGGFAAMPEPLSIDGLPDLPPLGSG